jgi:hypothetical protein
VRFSARPRCLYVGTYSVTLDLGIHGTEQGALPDAADRNNDIAIGAGFLAAPFLARRRHGFATLLLTLGCVFSIVVALVADPVHFDGCHLRVHRKRLRSDHRPRQSTSGAAHPHEDLRVLSSGIGRRRSRSMTRRQRRIARVGAGEHTCFESVYPPGAQRCYGLDPCS